MIHHQWHQQTYQQIATIATISPTLSPTHCYYKDTNCRLLFLNGNEDVINGGWCYEYKIIKKRNIENYCTLNNSNIVSFSIQFNCNNNNKDNIYNLTDYYIK